MYTKTILALFAAGLAAVNAYTTPVGASPEGNPISQPGLSSIVPVGENFTITWNPTTKGTVSLILLKGPATDLKLVYPIAEKVENSGSYVWLPKADLAPQDTGYGIQLIVDSNGQYQYTTQFGISNPDYKAAPAGYGAGYGAATTSSATTSESHSASATATATPITSAYPIKANTTLTGTAPIGTGASSYPAGNSSLVRPTGSLTVPTSLRSTATFATYSSASASASAASATSAAASQPSSGAGNIAASIGGLAIAAGVAVFAL